MRSRDVDIVMIPGVGGSGPDHWQSRWQAKLPNAHRAEQADWDNPDLTAWTGRLVETLARCERPIVLVAHSLGVTTAVHAAAGTLPTIAGAFLVAPPSDEATADVPGIDPAFRPTPRILLPCPALVVSSRNDPYASADEVAAFASDWGARLVDAGEAGHINTESGHGPWPEGLMTFAGFLNRL